jgi:hypothetical protein
MTKIKIMKKVLLSIMLVLALVSCDIPNCDTCITKESHPDISTPKTGVVTKIMLNSHSESSQDFIIYFDDENGINRSFESKTLSLPGDTITWY